MSTKKKKVLSLLLALVMVFSLLPGAALAAGTGDASTDFMRIMHLDCGRKYFSVQEVEAIIDKLAENHYTHIELAFGNEGLRLLLDEDDMGVGSYSGEEVRSALETGNLSYDQSQTFSGDQGAWTASQMTDLIKYANAKGIGVIPMFDAPGHMNAVIAAMNQLGISVSVFSQVGYTYPGNIGQSFDPTNAAATEFVKGLMDNYIKFFQDNGCKYFNFAGDECGFGTMSTAQYTAYAELINSLAAAVKSADMVPMMFNDGVYYKNRTTNTAFDTDIVICYWDASTNKYASAADLASKGFDIINTNNKWYYVAGKEGTEWFGYKWALSYMNGDSKDCTIVDGGYQTDVGCMAAFWCDNPQNDVNYDNLYTWIKTLANNNPNYFKEAETPVNPTPVITAPSSISLYNANGVTLTSTIAANWKTNDETIVSLSPVTATRAAEVYGTSVLAKPVGPGTATITATTDAGQSASVKITVTEAGETPAPDTVDRTITVTLGGTATDTIEGYNYAGNYPTDNPEIATANVTGQDEQEGSIEYSLASNVSYNDFIATKSDSWTPTSYYYKVSNKYYQIYAKRADTQWSSGYSYYSYSLGYYSNSSSQNITTLINSQSAYSWNSPNLTVYTQSGTLTQPASTTVTFKGLNVGTTTVTVGHVRYTIKVVAEDLSTVSKLPFQLWFTNCDIEVDTTKYTGGRTSSNFVSGNWQDNKRPYYVSVSANDAYGEKGVALSEVLPGTMMRYENSNTYWIQEYTGKVQKELVLWSGRVHDSSDSNIQLISGKDYSNSGTEFSFVRYYDGNWAVSNDQITWMVVTGRNSTNSPTNCEQLAVYYMMRSTITKEVTTDVADWGYTNEDNEYTTKIKAKEYVMLDFAVKYQDGTRVPSSFPVDGKTFVFHCTPNDGSGAVKQGSSGKYYRQLNNFRAVNSDEYEVYMVTVTMTGTSASDTLSSTTSYTYNDKTEQIVWAIDQDAKDNSGLSDYTSISGGDSDYSGCTIGGDPYVRGVEVYNEQGALITYYVRAKVTEDSLTVHYVDQTTNHEFYKYGITVNSGTLFDKDIKLNDNTWKGPLDNGTVKNHLGVDQTVTADLSKMIEIPAQYRYAVDYTCVKVERKNGGKEVWLYYTFKSDKSFVVDYGLPLTIKPADISPTLGTAALDSVTVTGNQYANIAYDETTQNFTYTLNQMMKGVDQLKVKYTGTITKGDGTQSGEVEYTINIIPASTMYYEENFVDVLPGTGIANAAWETIGATSPTIENQALEALGSGNTNPYGYDPAYDDCKDYSMGGAQKVTVTSNMATSWTATASWPTATFTFKGTGFDVISLTNNQSGAIFVDVYEGDTASSNAVKSFVVNNYYGYTQKDGQWVVDTANTSNNALYQIPVMKVSDLPYKQYTVKITLFYNSGFDKTNDNQYSFWLDAIRIYDPMDVNYADYAKDREGYPQYINFHSIMTNAQNDGKTVFIDGKDNAAVSEYTNYGPNNEVYLTNGQSVAFKLNSTTNIDTVQIGAKAPKGEEVAFRVGGSRTITLKTATDMYYDITDVAKTGSVVTITNTGTGLLSLTNLKITYSTKSTTTLAALTDADQDAALKVVRSVFAAEAPVIEPFVPQRFEAKWDRSVRAGQRATLTVKTSEDVAAISVDGQVIDSYRTYTERSGWGWNATRVTYRVFTYTVTPTETTDYTVAALNSDGVASTPITATLTVTTQRPGGWWGNGWWY